MPISFARAQSKLLNTNFLDLNADEKALYIVIEDTLEQYGSKFLITFNKYINQLDVKASGKLVSETKTLVRQNPKGTSLILSMPYYYDFPNEGVKGWRSSTNAPNSPYKFKTKGMDEEGRKSIKNYIQSGKATINNTGKYQYGGEKSKKPLIDIQTDNLVYLIKKYGIKATHYFDLAFEETFKELAVDVSEMVGEEVKMSIVKSFQNKK